jgi:hypothetical protein
MTPLRKLNRWVEADLQDRDREAGGDFAEGDFAKHLLNRAL